jgi:uncharacterized protein
VNRFFAETRAEVSGDTLRGHAAVFGVMANLPQHYEQLDNSAFDNVINDDVRALVNHNPSLLLARSKSGTLKLGVDKTGLAFEIPKLPNTSYARDLRELVERGDLDGMSFGFMPGEDEWSKAPDGRQLRTHTNLAALIDVSPVTFPAYTGTDVALRAVDFSNRPNNRSKLIFIRSKLLKP